MKLSFSISNTSKKPLSKPLSSFTSLETLPVTKSIPLSTLNTSVSISSQPASIVIPLITNNEWRLKNQAVAELIKEAEGKQDNEEKTVSSNKVIPLLMQNAVPGVTSKLDESTRLNVDVQVRPDECGLEAYERIPIEEFGAAMLRGMGWSDEKPEVGLTNARVVKPVEHGTGNGRKGLGADSASVFTLKSVKKIIAPGEKREVLPDVKKRSVEKEEPPKPKHKKLSLEWVSRGIYVRIINPKIYDGNVYEQKGYVSSVSSSTFAVKLEKSGDIIEDLVEADVQTALPKLKGKVVFVRGDYKGKTGELVDKDSDRNKGWVATDKKEIKCELDDIAGYI